MRFVLFSLNLVLYDNKGITEIFIFVITSAFVGFRSKTSSFPNVEDDENPCGWHCLIRIPFEDYPLKIVICA